MRRKTPEQVRHDVCGSKIPHRRADAARHHADSLRRRTGAPFVAYRCPFCARWHVGHTPSIDSLTNIARVMRGLDTADPEPHAPPARQRRRRRKETSR